jgi:hypothetical protein
MDQDESSQVEWLLYESVGGVVPNQQGTFERVPQVHGLGCVFVPTEMGLQNSAEQTEQTMCQRTLKQQTSTNMCIMCNIPNKEK